MTISYNGTVINKITYNGTEIFGGGMEKTVLWTNNSPNTSMGYQTLSGINYSTYDYVMIEYKRSTSENISANALFKVSDYAQESRTMAMVVGIGMGNETYVRPFYLMSSNQILVISSIDIKTGSNKDGYNIPTKIYGIKGKIN